MSGSRRQIDTTTGMRSSLTVLLAGLIAVSTAVGAATAAPIDPTNPRPYVDPCENIARYLNYDVDGDGLSGYQECQLGTSNKTSDTDHDGLDDPSEVQIGTDPLDEDTDGDRLSDCWEYYHGYPADPLALAADADGDGIGTELEVEVGLNPYDQDTDHDMLWDDEEALPQACYVKSEAGFWYAQEPDVDGDGLDDGVEAKSLGTAWWAPDTDGDGYSDGGEVFTWGTDPLDPNSYPPDYPPDHP